MHQRHTRVEQQPGCPQILLKIELASSRPVQRVPTKPHDHDAIDDLRSKQSGGAHISRSSDRHHVERLRSGGQSALDQVLHRGRPPRWLFVCQPFGCSLQDSYSCASEHGEHSMDLLIALPHTIARPVGLAIVERCGVDRL